MPECGCECSSRLQCTVQAHAPFDPEARRHTDPCHVVVWKSCSGSDIAIHGWPNAASDPLWPPPCSPIKRDRGRINRFRALVRFPNDIEKRGIAGNIKLVPCISLLARANDGMPIGTIVRRDIREREWWILPGNRGRGIAQGHTRSPGAVKRKIDFVSRSCLEALNFEVFTVRRI